MFEFLPQNFLSSSGVANTIKKLPIPIMRLIHPGASYLVSSQEDIKASIRAPLDHGNNTEVKSVIVQALVEDTTIPSPGEDTRPPRR